MTSRATSSQYFARCQREKPSVARRRAARRAPSQLDGVVGHPQRADPAAEDAAEQDCERERDEGEQGEAGQRMPAQPAADQHQRVDAEIEPDPACGLALCEWPRGEHQADEEGEARRLHAAAQPDQSPRARPRVHETAISAPASAR